MKKVLLTSTALVLLAGTASADIALSGSAEMGVRGGQLDATNADGTEFDETIPLQFHTDIDVTFTLSGETDGGLAFGAAIDLDESGDGSPAVDNDFDDGGVAIFISGDFGTLTLGDTDGALDFVTQDMGIANPGSIDDSETEHFGYLGAWLDGSGDGQIARYDISIDAFTFAVSVEQMPTGEGGLVLEDDDDLTWAVGFGYDFDFAGGSAGVSIGYQYSDNGSIDVGDSVDGEDINLVFNAGEVAATAVGASVSLDNGLSAAFTYTNFDFDEGEDADHFGIGVGYEFDAFSIHANYGTWESDVGDLSGFGLAGAYDLGGGASLHLAYGSSSSDLDDSEEEFDVDTYSFGVAFSF
ncbi:MAG: porin [Pseudomonadota bacterium]